MKQTTEKEQNRIDMIIEVLTKRASFNDATAYETAVRVMNYFGYSDEMVDNALDSDDRKLFYFMQDLGILGTRWEETQLISGRNWRIFYWRLNLIRMRRTLRNIEESAVMGDVYITIPDRVWQDHDVPSHT